MCFLHGPDYGIRAKFDTDRNMCNIASFEDKHRTGRPIEVSAADMFKTPTKASATNLILKNMTKVVFHFHYFPLDKSKKMSNMTCKQFHILCLGGNHIMFRG